MEMIKNEVVGTGYMHSGASGEHVDVDVETNTRPEASVARTAQTSSSISIRVLQGVEYDGDYDFVDVGEDADTYITDIYQCNEALARIPDTELEKPKVAGDYVRICIRPTASTIERGVVMRRIDAFKFTKDEWQGASTSTTSESTSSPQSSSSSSSTSDTDTASSGSPTITQLVVVEGKEQENTLLTCEPGSEICVFKTQLEQDFFRDDGKVKGTGYAFLEHGGKESSVFGGLGRRHRRRNMRGSYRRGLQDKDVNFAGIWQLEIEFPVQESFSQGFVGEANDTWEDLNQGARYGIIVGILTILLCFICCLLYCCAYLYKRDREMSERVDGHFPKEVKVNPRASYFDLFMQSWNGNLNHGRDDSEHDCDGDSVLDGSIPVKRLTYGGRDDTLASSAVTGAVSDDNSNNPSSSTVKKPARDGKRTIANKITKPANKTPETYVRKKPFLRPRPPPLKPKQAQESSPDVSRSQHSTSSSQTSPSPAVARMNQNNPPKKARSLTKKKTSPSGDQPPSGPKKLSQTPKQKKIKNANSSPKQTPSLSKKSTTNHVAKAKHPEDSHSEASTSKETEDHSSSKESEGQHDEPESEVKDIGKRCDRTKDKVSVVEGSPSAYSVDISALDVDEWSSDSDSDSDGEKDNDADKHDEEDVNRMDTSQHEKPRSNVSEQPERPASPPEGNGNDIKDDDDEESIDVVNGCLTTKSGSPSIDDDKSDSESVESALSDESDFFPDPFDVAFDQKNHVGTMVLEMTIRKVASSMNGVTFSKAIFDTIEADLKGRTCYRQDVAQDGSELWKEATHAEKMKYFRTCYDNEVRQDEEMKRRRGVSQSAPASGVRRVAPAGSNY
jgi:hypothetical protein